MQVLVDSVRNRNLSVQYLHPLDEPARGSWKVPATNTPIVLMPTGDGGAKVLLLKNVLPSACLQWLRECRVEANGQLVRPGVNFDELLIPFRVPDGFEVNSVRVVLDCLRSYMNPFCQVRTTYFQRHVLPLILTILVISNVPGSGEYEALSSHNLVSWMLVPCAGLTWRGLDSIKACIGRGYFSCGDGALLGAKVLEDLTGFRLMPWRWLMQAKIAADMGPLQQFFCTLMLIQSILSTLYAVGLTFNRRVQIRRENRQSEIRIFVWELVILLVSYLTAELLSFLIFVFQIYSPIRCMLIYRWTWLRSSSLVSNIFHLYGWRALFFGLSLDRNFGHTLGQELSILNRRSLLQQAFLDPTAAILICDNSFTVRSLSAQGYDEIWGPLRLKLLRKFV